MNGAGPIRIEAASFSCQGGRDYNEDVLKDCQAPGDLHLFVLTDGAGGQGGGGVAASIAVAAAEAAFLESPVFSAETLRRCIAKADRAVVDSQGSKPGLARMASTIALLLVERGRAEALFANLGDSRCYVFLEGRITARSQDHSLVQRFVEAGLVAPEKLRQHPQRNVLYAALGANGEGIEPHVCEEPVRLQPGTGMMLCSDGVWELLDDDQLAQLHANSTDVDTWRAQLTSALEARMPPGHDNYSGYVVRCQAPARPQDRSS